MPVPTLRGFGVGSLSYVPEKAFAKTYDGLCLLAKKKMINVAITSEPRPPKIPANIISALNVTAEDFTECKGSTGESSTKS